jgi:cell division protein FtsA
MATKSIFALDVGSASIKGLVANFTPKKEALEIVCKVESPAAGMHKGAVSDIDDASRAISALLDEIESIVERDFKGVVVSVGGPHLETRFSKGTVVVSRADEEIGKEDMDRAIQAVCATSLPQNRMLLHALPRTFLIDEMDRVKDPVGMQGTRLSCEAILIDAFSQPVKFLQKSLSVVGLTPTDIIASFLAGSLAAVPKKEKNLGVLALDFGAETTSLTVFEDGDLIHAKVLPLGSRNVTADLASGLKIHFDSAERMKTEVGHALSSQVSKKEMVNLANFIEGGDEIISRKYVADIIEARISEIFELVADELKVIGRQGKLAGGVILFGGGSRIPGIESLARRELKLLSRLASLDHYRKVFPEGIPIQFYPACGLILWTLESLFGPARSEAKGPLAAIKKVFKALLP